MEMVAEKLAEFRQRVEAEWTADETAAAWKKHYPRMRKQLREVTEALVKSADPRPGMLVLDLASGPGEPALPLAKRVAPGGKVVATDLSAGMLASLQENAAEEGVTNIEARRCDAAQELPFPDATFDLVTSRFGVMFFAEIERTLAEVRRVLKPGGRAAFMVWGRPMPGTYFGAAVMPYISRLPERPDPDGPGPMRFAQDGKLAGKLEAAGFRDVREVRRALPTPYEGSPAHFLASIMEIATPLRNAVAGLPARDRREADEEALANLRRAHDGEYVRLSAEIVIVTGVAG